MGKQWKQWLALFWGSKISAAGGCSHEIKRHILLASGPITSWEMDGETVEIVSDFTFGGSKITADGDCSHEIKRCLLLGGSYGQPRQNIKKQRHYFANKGPSSQDYGFSSGHMDVRVGL